MVANLSDVKSTLVQVMACAIRHQAITWANVDQDLSSYGITKSTLGAAYVVLVTDIFISVKGLLSDLKKVIIWTDDQSLLHS